MQAHFKVLHSRVVMKLLYSASGLMVLSLSVGRSLLTAPSPSPHIFTHPTTVNWLPRNKGKGTSICTKTQCPHCCQYPI